ncbi:Prostate androgen-regulated mucin-like protein 1 -like protein [Channa argus]|uniref:Prostate androgen-regulated mucin-like protein 1-like protein n=1 Tax=Channa argus TaxID=215402 RepID=A0A6G1QIM3_CHAAH|nr:Prostate androgen-regulated mucin-like protein 1 -like protein [Channa argus]
MPHINCMCCSLLAGSIAGIVCVFLICALVALGGLYYYKIRRTSYGPLLDSNDYGTLGNFSNPIYESS